MFMFAGGMRYAGLLALMALLSSGCSSIPPEELAKLATVEAAGGYTLHSVDSNITLFSSSANVKPGEHSFEMTMACYNNQCSYQTYRFNAEAGHLYRLMPNRTILVLDRNDRFERKLDELSPVGTGIDYVTRDQSRQHALEAARQAQVARAALIESRRQNLPLVKKVGARICQVQGQLLYIGFVEDFTDEKVRVRVDDARINENQTYRVTNFKPKVIWDSLLNWDVCE